MISLFLLYIIASLVFATLKINISSNANFCEIKNNVVNPSPEPDPNSPETFTVSFTTNISNDSTPIIIQVNRSWAPLGSDRFYSLVNDGYYNQAAFFRVVPNFVIQFGISAMPNETAKWNTPIPDDPVVMSNTAWTVSYATAGPNTRTSQIFINLVDNSRLDASGFAPFGKVVLGFETILQIVNPTPGDSDGVNQEIYEYKGNDWLLSKYPDISLISCTDVEER